MSTICGDAYTTAFAASVLAPNNATIGKNTQTNPQGKIGFGQCMTGALINNFIGNDGLTGVTLTVNIAALVAKQAAGSLLPGPGWLYTGVAIGYDGLMIAKSYASCKTTGGFEDESGN